jgi:RNA polymerase sigma-70 factor (ECF subfamily)
VGACRPPSSVTQLLRQWQQGDTAAAADLVAAIHAELRRLAAVRLRQERRDHTLQPTALVNEAWIRLADVREDWRNRAQFFGMAAIAMRRILVDHARRRHAAKRGDGREHVALDDALNALASPLPDERLLALDEALSRLEQLDPRQARVVELRFFTGLSVADTAALLGISAGTVKREWAAARAWLFDAIQGTPLDEPT